MDTVDQQMTELAQRYNVTVRLASLTRVDGGGIAHTATADGADVGHVEVEAGDRTAAVLALCSEVGERMREDGDDGGGENYCRG